MKGGGAKTMHQQIFNCLVAMHSVRNQINFSFAAWDDMKLKEAQSGGKNSPCSKIPELNFGEKFSLDKLL